MTNTNHPKTRLDSLNERYATMPAGKERSGVWREIKAEIDSSQLDNILAGGVERRRRARSPHVPSEIRPEAVRVIENRTIPDPSMSDAEFHHQRAQKPNDPTVGKVWSQENAVTRIGGLAFIRRRLSHHEHAAEWFKNAYEALYGGIAPAIDASRVRVDTSIMFHDDAAVERVYNGWEMQDTLAGLGDLADRVVAVIVLCIPCGDLAKPGPSGKPSGHAVEKEVDHLLSALDRICELRGFKTKAA